MDQLSFSVKGQTFTVSNPSVGNFIDLWRWRSILSGGNYGNIYRFGMPIADEALLMVDIESFFVSFCPSFIKSLKSGSIKDMGLEDYLELKEIYNIQIQPWLDSIEKLMINKKDEKK